MQWNMMKIIGFVLLSGAVLAVLVWLGVRSSEEIKVAGEKIQIAFIGPLSGDEESEGLPIKRGIQLYLDEINAKGGVLEGKKLELKSFDDHNDPIRAAKEATKIVTENSVIAIVGHYGSPTSVKGGEIYAQHEIPAITPSATNVQVTEGKPWYFRATFNDRLQGRFLANYLKKVLQQNVVTIIHHDGIYGSYLAEVFEKASQELGMKIKSKYLFHSKDEQLEDSLKRIVNDLRSTQEINGEEVGFIFLAALASEGTKLIKFLKDSGVKASVILPAAFVSKAFRESFSKFPKEKQNRGYYTDGIYISTPLIFDTANELAQDFRKNYKKVYQEEADVRAASGYDAAMLIVEAIKNAGVQGKKETLKTDRQEIRNYLAKINNSGDAIEGVTGLNYFDENRDAQKPISIGTFKNNNIVSALVQLQDVRNLNEIPDMEKAIEEGRIVQIDDKPMYKTNVIYTGVKINQISDLNIKGLTYLLDFNLWFRYRGDIRPQDIEFLNAIEPIRLWQANEINKVVEEKSLAPESQWLENLGEISEKAGQSAANALSPMSTKKSQSPSDNLSSFLPTQTSVTMELLNTIEPHDDKEQMAYRLYRVKSRFKADFLSTRYLNQHELGVSFRHRDLTRNNLIYVTDELGMGLGLLEREDGFSEKLQKAQVLNPLSKWDISKDMRFFQDIMKENSLGNPNYLNARGGKIEYSQFNMGVMITNNEFTLRRTLSSSTALTMFFLSSTVMLFLIFTSKQLRRFSKSIWFFYAIFAFFLLWSSEIVFIGQINDEKSGILDKVIEMFDVLWWFVPAVLLHLAVELFLWTPLEERTGRKIPRIGRRFVSFTIYTITFFAIVAFVYDQKLTSLLATSGVIAMIIGLAIQINISNIFSGIAINVEQPFRVGDWVTIGSFEEGKVVDITWRTTRIITRAGCILSIPNSVASESPIHNYDYPDDSFWIRFIVHIHPAHPPERVQKIIRDAVLSTEVVLKVPDPYIIFRGISDWAADYLVYCAVRDYTWKLLHEEAIWTRIWIHLNRAGITPAIQRQEIHLFKGVKERGEEAATKPITVLQEVDIFRPFSEEAKAYLSEHMHTHRAPEGEIIVRQGDVGNSLFILVEGVVGVRVRSQSGELIEVARLGAGNFFGEMALLTGEERTATVIAVTDTVLFEITKEDIAGLMAQQREVSELISKILTQRQMMTQSQMHAKRDMPIEEEALYKRFREKIENFFGLRNIG